MFLMLIIFSTEHVCSHSHIKISFKYKGAELSASSRTGLMSGLGLEGIR